MPKHPVQEATGGGGGSAWDSARFSSAALIEGQRAIQRCGDGGAWGARAPRELSAGGELAAAALTVRCKGSAGQDGRGRDHRPPTVPGGGGGERVRGGVKHIISTQGLIN